ncbi:MAG TPA: tetratricopeptide repeat protein [Verrucomicrobiae bacterium]|nr:tetratricopeptide repeat protein [Verrucomicrobiae bacterium]
MTIVRSRRRRCSWLVPAMNFPPFLVCLFGGVMLSGFCSRGRAADLDDARPLFIKGQYAECIHACEAAIAEREPSEEWRLLLAKSMMALGRYTNAYTVISTNLERFPWSVRLRLLGREVYLQNGQVNEAAGLLAEINTLAGYRMWAYQDTANLVAVGRAALLLGMDPRRVLEQFFDVAKKRDPSNREPYLAAGDLALAKNDYELASKSFSQGLKKFADDPDFHFGLARSYAPSDRLQMLASLDATLTRNTNHVDSYLLLVDHLVDGEDYHEAEENLKKVFAVNPNHPKAWAHRAVLAHLRNDAAGETKSRENALRYWDTNPEVDHLIGRKLSQKYRFAEGAACQRRALEFDPKFLPAKIQLSQDLLRLGQEEEGWRLAEEVHNADAYDVTAFNLSALQENLAKFAVLTNADFLVRMSTNEAAIYGDRVLELLQRAKNTLCAKYGLELTHPTIVEIFPEPKDFGVRTFGMPGNPGYLGVCFGSVITANSPASQTGHTANWQAVLWHEFCHVVTLQLTKNKMPRWLSEGISVHEELQQNPTWGQVMTPRYREMVLGKEFTPLSELSAAFLAPKSETHLQFAYYESALAVEFLVSKFGLDALKAILHDLGEGAEINVAIANHTAPIDEVEKQFSKFARDRAENLAPGLEFSKPERNTDDDSADSKNYYVLTRYARKLIRDRKWAEAKVPLQKLLTLYPGNTSSDSAYPLLAQAHRHLNETNEERVVLHQLASRAADEADAYGRLMELEAAAGNWPSVRTNAQRYLAVNPLTPTPYRQLAQASEALGDRDEAIRACRTLLRLDPPDPAGAHYQLARLLHQTGDPGARRHLLQALEEAPRFREAHRLLLQLNAESPSPAPAPPAPSTSPPPVPPASKPDKLEAEPGRARQPEPQRP